MRNAFIYTPAECTIQALWAVVAQSGMNAVRYEESFAFAVGKDDEAVYVDEMPDLEEVLDEEGQMWAQKCGPNPRFYRMRFRDPQCAAQVIVKGFPRRQEFVLDNDHGLFLTIDHFADLYLKNSDWDWSIAEHSPDSPP